MATRWDEVAIGQWLQGKVIQNTYQDGLVHLVNLAHVIDLCFKILNDTQVPSDVAEVILNSSDKKASHAFRAWRDSLIVETPNNDD